MIEVRNLTKHFGHIKAVRDVSFTVEKGEILGFLGPNGAGKSTTMRMITGFIPPTSGTALIGGSDICRDGIEARQKIGYLPENAPVYPDMTVFGYLDFCAQIRGFSRKTRKKTVLDSIEQCFLKDVKYQTINTLSKGFKQRVCFAQCILHDPEYLILDEPTDGLDPNQKHEVRLMIQKMSAQKAIILSTHILDEVDAICSRAIIIAGGNIVADDTPDNLRSRSIRHGAISIGLANCEPLEVRSCLEKIEGVRSVEIDATENGGVIQIRVFPQNRQASMAEPILATLHNHRFTVESLFVETGKLDDVFRTITQ
jgi:ABC-2 type transport system ATP-binding protein